MMRIGYTLLVAVCCQLQAAGGAWPQPKSSGFFKLDHTLILAGNFFDASGNVLPVRELSQATSSVYGEFGLSRRLTALGYLPFRVSNSLSTVAIQQNGNPMDLQQRNTALGDADLGLRYGILLNGPVVLSARLQLGFPTGQANHPLRLDTGDGEFNQLLGLEAGLGLGNGWLSGALGFNQRSGGFSDEWRLHLELGWKLARQQLLLIGKMSVLQSLENGTAPAGNFLFSNNQSYVSPQLEIAWKPRKHLGFVYRLGTALGGRNIQAAPSHSLGAFLEIN
jgi:hypothetical protein